VSKINGRAHFIVDQDECIGCGRCQDMAPNNIELLGWEVVARVYEQPKNDEDEAACFDAMDYCPTGGMQAVMGDVAGQTESDAESDAGSEAASS
jgi:ferredoxin